MSSSLPMKGLTYLAPAFSAKIGADVVTLPAAVLAKMLGHSLTDKGLKAFLADWNKLQSELSNKA